MPWPLYPGERALSTHWVGGLVGPEPVWMRWRSENFCLYWDLNSDLAVQPIASCYTDFTILACGPARPNINKYWFVYLTLLFTANISLGFKFIYSANISIHLFIQQKEWYFNLKISMNMIPLPRIHASEESLWWFM
jgi:hypothetical protein